MSAAASVSPAAESQSPSGPLLGLVSCAVNIYEQNMVGMGAVLATTLFLFLDSFDKLLQITIAISNSATMREMSNLWMYIHHFVPCEEALDPVERLRLEIEAQNLSSAAPNSPEMTYKYMFRSRTLLQTVTNFLLFLATGRHQKN